VGRHRDLGFTEFDGNIFKQFVVYFRVVDVWAEVIWIREGEFKNLATLANDPGTEVVEAIIAHVTGNDKPGNP
jgi:hypothetical protein